MYNMNNMNSMNGMGNIGDRLYNISLSISNLQERMSSLTHAVNNSASNGNNYEFEKIMLEVLKSNLRIEECILDQNELKKYELGLPSKYDIIERKNKINSNQPATFVKKR